MKFSTYIILAFCALLILTGGASLFITNRILESSLQQVDAAWAETLLSTVAEGVAHDTINKNVLHATETLQNIVNKTDELEYAYLTDFEGRIFAHTFTEGFPKKLLKIHKDNAEQNITLDGKPIRELDYPIIEGMKAYIHIGNSLEYERAFVNSVLKKIAYFFGMIMIAGILAAYMISRRLAKPLEMITHSIENYGKGTEWKLGSKRQDIMEVRKLGNVFEEMVHLKEKANLEASQFKSTLDQTLDCVFMFDPVTLKFFYTNKGAQLQVGYSSEELHHMTAVAIKPHYNEDEFKELISPLLKGEINSVRFETEHQHRDGHRIPVEIFLQYISIAGELPRFVAMVQDISERKKKDEEILNLNADLERRIKIRTSELESSLVRVNQENADRLKAEAELLKAKEEAEKANDLKSEFMGRMSHELRTPMNAIMGFGQLLEVEDLTDNQQDFVKEVMDAAKHLLHLIDEVLDLAKIEAGKIDLNIENVSVENIMHETLAMVGNMAELKNIKMENFVDDKSLFVKADSVRLKEIITNLVTNAIKYNSEKGTVTINASKRDGDIVRLQFTDTGKGLTKQQCGVLFEPFNRLGAEYSDIEGTGIGLTISRQLVELMHGTIGVESEVDVGSTFWVDLLLAKADEQHSKNEQKTIINTGERNKVRVLYVEDNPANLRLVQKVLKTEQGVSLISATSAELGIELAKAKRPDLIIMDINLPGMDGYEALSRLRNFKETTDIPVLALSAAAMPRDIERGLLAGFRRYLTKPIQIEELRQAINDLANRKQNHLISK